MLITAAEQSYIGQYFEHTLKTADESYIFLALVIIGLLAVVTAVTALFFLSRSDRASFDEKLAKKEKEWKDKYLSTVDFWTKKNELKNEELRNSAIQQYKTIDQFTSTLTQNNTIIAKMVEVNEGLKKEIQELKDEMRGV